MAKAVHVPGTALIRIDVSEAHDSLSDLGYCRNGADIVFDGFFINVPGDENGGDEGPPIEVLQLGQMARVRLEMTKYEASIIDVINSRIWGTAGGTDELVAGGTPPAVGRMMFGENLTFRLLVQTTHRAYNFPRTFCRSPIELPQYGSKFSMVICEFECHKSAAGVLFNSTTA